jgi:TonB family protein
MIKDYHDGFPACISIQVNMTSTQVNPPEKSEGFDIYVKKLRSICDMHGVRFGSPYDLTDFMQKLAENKHFAMDFWAFTGTLSSREGGGLSNDQMLAVVVESVACSEIPGADFGLRKLVNDLASLLAGVDLHSPVSQDNVQPQPLSRSDARWESAPADMPQTGEEIPLKFSARVSAPESDQTSVPAKLPAELNEALLRLELNSQELKQYLDKIDDRMSKLERLEERSSVVSPVNERVHSPVEEPSSRAVEEHVRRNGERARLVLEPDVRVNEDGVEGASVRIPLAGYSHQGGHSKLIVSVLLVLLVAAGIFVQRRYGALLATEFGSLVEKMHGASAVESSEAKAPSDITAASAEESAIRPPVEGTAAPSESRASTVQERTVRAPATGSQEAVRKQGSYERRNEVVTRAALNQLEEDSVAEGDQRGPINVYPGLMEANLILSRVPTYPEAAKVKQVEGPVVAQVVISKIGTVEQVHVIDGDPLLRNAAADAIQKWRYKPYLFNGEPIDVTTTVTVNFKLDQ